MKRKKHTKFKIAVIVVCAVVIAVLIAFQRNATQTLMNISEATIRSITTVAVNNAVYYTLDDSLRYEDLVTIERDADGNVTSITTDSLKINRIARDTAYLSQKNLTEMSSGGIMVPIGAFTGIELFAGFGKKVNIKIIPISNVECGFVSKFEAAGINQTKHSLCLEIVSAVSIIMPTKTTELASTTEVLVCESVIAGKIPDVYLQGSGGGILAPKSAY